jgi:hypothetical protein
MSEDAAEADLARPVGGRLGLLVLAAVALAGLGQGLASILWNDFAIPGGPEPTEEVIDDSLRETPPVKPPAPKAAEAAAEAAASQNKVVEAPKPPPAEPPQNTVDTLPKAPFPYASAPPAPVLQIPPQAEAPQTAPPAPAPAAPPPSNEDAPT